MQFRWWILWGAMACSGGDDAVDDEGDDSGLQAADDVCEVDLECCAYACQSEAFWSTYNNDCTCAPSSTQGDPNRECAFVDGACAFTE